MKLIACIQEHVSFKNKNFWRKTVFCLFTFLDAASHLYKRVCPSVSRSVRRSVRNAFVKIAENGLMQDGDASYVVYTALLDASSHLYKSVCPSIHPSVSQSVGP